MFVFVFLIRYIFFVSVMVTCRDRWTLTQNLVPMLRLIMSHIHQEGIKSFSAYIIEESGKSRANLSGRYEMV